MELAQKGRYPPNANEQTKKMMKRILTSRITWDRPVSVEAERRAITRSRNRKRLYIGVILVLLGAWAGIAGRTAASSLHSLVASIRTRLRI